VSKHCFVIDLARCTGCQTCSIACKDRANLPDDVDWLSVQTREGGSYPALTLTYRVMHCFHCAEPPCVEVCPTEAIAKQESGWVQIETELCIACGACVDACPFSVIVIRPEGTANKCDGCADEVGQGRQPVCVRACPMRALDYGTRGSPWLEKRVADRDFQDYGVGPSVLYLRRPDD
jgi:anaerobic dimethyl sulfoxide reductase subunit B (iron-sulfur subunit)